jgi:hypothetical protein
MLHLCDEVAWELLADQCEEGGEPEGVGRLALAMAWRVALQRLHGLAEADRGVMKALAHLEQATSSQGALRHLEKVREAAEVDSFRHSGGQPSGHAVMGALQLRATLAAIDRSPRLHDRLKARGLLREG